MQYFFHPNAALNQTISIEEGEAHHITNVLRHKVGDVLFVLNGKGAMFEAVVLTAGKRDCTLKIKTLLRHEPENTNKIFLAVSPVKNAVRIEWMLEKIVELGVAGFCFLLCQRTEKFYDKTGRFEKILQSGLKQSGNLWMPEMHGAVKFETLVKGTFEKKYIANCSEAGNLLNGKKSVDGSTLLMVGPEGDFTENELLLAQENNCESISLGKLRLRTETAALVAATLLTQQALKS